MRLTEKIMQAIRDGQDGEGRLTCPFVQLEGLVEALAFLANVDGLCAQVSSDGDDTVVRAYDSPARESAIWTVRLVWRA